MSKIHTDRLKGRYQGFSITQSIGSLLTDIFVANQEEVSEKIYEKTSKTLKNSRLTLPKKYDMDNSIRIDKLKLNGKTIANNLREKLVNDLKQVLKKPPTKLQGKHKGETKDTIAKEFEALIRDTFKNYVKIDPTYGVPANIKAIALTETQASINDAKHEYMNNLLEENPKAKIDKTWIHHSHRLKKAKSRLHHLALNGVTIGTNKRFTIKSPYNGTIKALYPHDPDIPVGEIVNCRCECVYDIKQS